VGDVPWVLADLAPGEADHLKAGEEQRGVAPAVLVEGGRSQVRRGAVGLGDEPRLAPEEIDLVAGDRRVDLGSRKPGLRDEGEEALLEFASGDVRVGEGEGREGLSARERRPVSRASWFSTAWASSVRVTSALWQARWS